MNMSHLFSQGQILANLKAMDSDYFAKTYMNRTEKVSGL